MIQNSSPIIIIGMHRSGTAMLAELLESAGVYQGWRKEHNHESTFFLKLNDWILRELGARWDTPETLIDINAGSQVHCQVVKKYVEDQMCSMRAIEYLGVPSFIKHGAIPKLDGLWGWKDPRTTLLLEIWLQIFPNAKVIHIVRNGVDVANSLRERTEQVLHDFAQSYDRKKMLYSIAGKRTGFVDSARCLTLEGGFSLWEAYLDIASHQKEGVKNFLEFKYEDLLLRPEQVLPAIESFCDVQFDSGDALISRGLLNPEKSNKYLSSSELLEFHESVKDRLQRHGYT